MEKEKQIERKLVESVKIKKGLCLKFYSAYFTGLPDRIILLPQGRLHFVELKNNKGRLSERQKVVGRMLRELGFSVVVLTSVQEVENFLENI